MRLSLLSSSMRDVLVVNCQAGPNGQDAIKVQTDY
jgi:hypothetical protein